MTSYSMWSVIDLSPLDTKIDEKEENCLSLCEALKKNGLSSLAMEVKEFNDVVRAKLKKIYHLLPRSVFQGDLNDSNILVKDDHFYGLIDFNMAGTEVNVNCFACECDGFDENIMLSNDPSRAVSMMIENHYNRLNPVLKNYSFSQEEQQAFDLYLSLVMLFQYSTVVALIYYLDDYKQKVCDYIKEIITSRK
ncbi:MAG: hypothetical protein HUJ61_04060 [Bacilli bacterium]|nr:hypothetical protein [Bacilli bacterium]